MTSSEKIKCTQCNIVINELLCFVQNKICIMDEESLIRLGVSSFTTSEITIAKNLLFESLSTTTRNIARRKNKEQKDIEDIICVLKNTEPDATPIFVARELEKLPPVCFDHIDVTALLKDIVLLKTEIKNLKESYATTEQLDSVKAEINHMKFASIVNVNQKRGAYLLDSDRDSGPIGILNVSNYNGSPENQLTTEQLNWRSPSPPQKTSTAAAASRNSAVTFALGAGATNNASAIATVKASVASQASGERGSVGGHGGVLPAASTTPISIACKTSPPATASVLSKPITATVNKNKTLAEITLTGEWKAERPNEEWVQVQRRRHRNRTSESEGVRGKAAFMPDDKFKPATLKIALFLSNVHKDTLEKDILEYVFSKTNEKVVLQKIKMKTEKEYNSYKILVPNTKLHLFLTDELWPAGITCRRFRPYRNPVTGGEEENRAVSNEPI